MTTIRVETYSVSPPDSGAGRPPAMFWALLVSGGFWLLVAVLVLGADLDSARTIGYLVAGYLAVVGVLELALLGAGRGWRWLHVTVGVLFLLGSVLALTEPLRTFGLLASLLGVLLVFKGAMDLIVALATRHVEDLWWMLLVVGILEIGVGFWAAGYPGRSATLLVVWVGLGALLRGLSHIVLAFQVRRVARTEP